MKADGTQKACSFEDCEQLVIARGYCRKHYGDLYRAGKLELVKPKAKRAPVCSVVGCEQKHQARGYCGPHYRRWLRYGDPGTAEVQQQVSTAGTCEGPECDRPILARRLCETHYMQQQKKGTLSPIFKGQAPLGPCQVTGCVNQNRRTSGLCETHYRRKQSGDPEWDRPIIERASSGSGWVNDQGYRVITTDGRPRLEHRVIVARLLGRGLLPTETVHHVNGNRSDNAVDGPMKLDDNGRLRSGNLELWSKAQPAGQEIGPKITWAREILRLYRTNEERQRYAES